jgi:replicative DNA helicase
VAAMRAKGHPDVLIWVDYLSLVKSTDRYKGNRVKEVGEVTSTLKALAKELGVPVLLLAQLSRGVESRDDKRPHLADLRESGEIEQDADVVLFVYREEYYLTNVSTDGMNQQELMEHCTRMREVEGVMEIIVSKQRKGPTGIVKTKVDMSCNTVYELARRAA